MKTIGNILWFVLAGLWLAIGYVMAGIANCITIIGIPFGIQSFKLAAFVIWPFGRVVVAEASASGCLSTVGNIIWIIFGGLWMALAYLVCGVLLCITIIGIPFGVACFKQVGLAFAPFGKTIVSEDAIPPGATVVVRM